MLEACLGFAFDMSITLTSGCNVSLLLNAFVIADCFKSSRTIHITIVLANSKLPVYLVRN